MQLFPVYAISDDDLDDCRAFANSARHLPGNTRERISGRMGEIVARRALEARGVVVEDGPAYGNDLYAVTSAGHVPIEIKTRDGRFRPRMDYDVLVPAKRFARQGRESSWFLFLWAYESRGETFVYVLGAEPSDRVREWRYFDAGDPWPGSDHVSKYPVYRQTVAHLMTLDEAAEVLRA